MARQMSICSLCGTRGRQLSSLLMGALRCEFLLGLPTPMKTLALIDSCPDSRRVSLIAKAPCKVFDIGQGGHCFRSVIHLKLLVAWSACSSNSV